jgi:sugar (pentulose or hexulose) kinase
VRWIGLDIGTTHLKAVVYDDERGAAVAVDTCPTPVMERDGRAERDPDEVAEAAIALVSAAVRRSGPGPAVGALAIAGVGEEVVILDPEDAVARPTIAWYDPRGCADASRYLALHPTPLHRRFEPRAEFSLFKLLWLRRAEPDTLARCERLLDLSGYVLMRLGAPPVMDWSHACRTGLFDPATTTWDEESLAAAELPRSWWPRLVPSGEPVGRLDPDLARRLGISPSAVLVSGGHDHFCGAYASGIREPGEMYVSAGTSEAQLMLTNHPVEAGLEALAFDQGRFVDDRSWYVHLGLPSGHAFRQWAGSLYPDSDEAAIEREVATVTAAPEGVTFHLGTVSTGSSLRCRTFVAGRAMMMRAVLEGSAVASAGAIRALERVTGAGARRIVAAGHAPQRSLWRELRGGLLGRDLEIVRAPETAALGAALLAQRGVTGRADVDVVERTTWRPTRDHVAYGRTLMAAYEREPWWPDDAGS